MSLENKLMEIGDYRGSTEIESQMLFVDERLLSRIKQAHSHARQEMRCLKLVLIESTREDT